MNCLPLAWLIKGDFYSTRNWSNPAGEQWPQGLRAPCRGQSPWPGSGPLAGVRVLLGGTGADLGKSAEQSAWGAALRPAGSPQGSCQTFLGPGPRLSWKGLPTWRLPGLDRLRSRKLLEQYLAQSSCAGRAGVAIIIVTCL